MAIEADDRKIHAGLNVVEHWNGANNFLFFARPGQITSNRPGGPERPRSQSTDTLSLSAIWESRSMSSAFRPENSRSMTRRPPRPMLRQRRSWARLRTRQAWASPLTKHTKICRHAGQCTVCNAGFNCRPKILFPFCSPSDMVRLSPQRMRHEHRSR